jgi:hypothetical protein
VNTQVPLVTAKEFIRPLANQGNLYILPRAL